MSSGRGINGGVSRCYPFFAEFKECLVSIVVLGRRRCWVHGGRRCTGVMAAWDTDMSSLNSHVFERLHNLNLIYIYILYIYYIYIYILHTIYKWMECEGWGSEGTHFLCPLLCFYCGMIILTTRCSLSLSSLHNPIFIFYPSFMRSENRESNRAGGWHEEMEK